MQFSDGAFCQCQLLLGDRKMKVMKVRELIEMLAKCNWDDKVTVITEFENTLNNPKQQKKITAIAQSTQNGVELVFQEK